MIPFIQTLKRLLGRSPVQDPNRYEGDGMYLKHRNLSWMRKPEFLAAYESGINSGHQWGKDPDAPLHLEWRVQTALWAAHHAMALQGDFVECGVNTGILSLAVCNSLDFAKLTDRRMYLFDTFAGTPESLMSTKERSVRLKENKKFYPDCYEVAVKNFGSYPNVQLVRGIVPDTLDKVRIDRVAYLSLDMNIAAPERAAIEFFWPKLTSGAVVVLDDYGWAGFEEQMTSMDEFAASKGVRIGVLPTGQGLIIKP